MTAIGYSPSFLKSLDKLGSQDQATVSLALLHFMQAPETSGHRLHSLGTREKRFYSLSPNMALRLILLKDNGQFYAMYVDQHDKAYEWAARHRMEVHPKTFAAQLVEFEEVIREEIRYVPRIMEEPPLFVGEDDGYLLSLGVPPAWLETVKALDADGFYRVLDRLPEEAAEALMALYQGDRPDPASIRHHRDEADAANPYEHPDARRRFLVASDEQALRQALDYPWDRWIVFLHPSQREASTRDFGGPCRVSGAAGTGKTVVALHRAVHLAKQSDDARVLLTTYSQPLVRHLQGGLDRLVGMTGDVRRRIRVEHLHRYAHTLAADQPAFSFKAATPADITASLNRAVADAGDGGAGMGFLRAEFEAVIDYWGIRNARAYAGVRRTGRGAALSPERRAALWPIFDRMLTHLRNTGCMTWSDLADEALAAVQASGRPPFDHVVADEVQDFGPRELRFLMSLAELGRSSHFFTGDAGQRIYRYPFSWLGAGIDIRGRGARLAVNYRTTQQIQAFADEALGFVDAADEDEADSARNAVSLLTGPRPEIACASSVSEEVQGLAGWLRALLEDGIAPGEIGIFARARSDLEDIAGPAIEAAGLVSHSLMAQDKEPSQSQVAVGTLHAAKGLEFRAVAVVGCSADAIPHPAVLAAADGPEAEQVARARERQLLYVGLTRARDVLRVSYSGEPCPFLCKAGLR